MSMSRPARSGFVEYLPDAAVRSPSLMQRLEKTLLRPGSYFSFQRPTSTFSLPTITQFIQGLSQEERHPTAHGSLGTFRQGLLSLVGDCLGSTQDSQGRRSLRVFPNMQVIAGMDTGGGIGYTNRTATSRRQARRTQNLACKSQPAYLAAGRARW